MVFHIYTDSHCPTGDRFLPRDYSIEEFRIKRYNNGDRFKQHVDVGDASSSNRFLAFLFYLNDDFEGGGTLFRLPGAVYTTPKTGNCLVFPPTWQYPHEGMKANGTKYIMSTYLHYV
jgi:Rps23 Pro-64 3,4-dihydroxylase Tpa1-like proline 4-hydroxylase